MYISEPNQFNKIILPKYKTISLELSNAKHKINSICENLFSLFNTEHSSVKGKSKINNKFTSHLNLLKLSNNSVNRKTSIKVNPMNNNKCLENKSITLKKIIFSKTRNEPFLIKNQLLSIEKNQEPSNKLNSLLIDMTHKKTFCNSPTFNRFKTNKDIKFINKLNPQNNENESYPSIYNMREKFINVNNSLKLKDSLRTLKNSYEFNLDQKGKQRCVSKQRIAIFERESQKIIKTKNSSNVKPQSNVKIYKRRTLKEYLKRKYYYLI